MLQLMCRHVSKQVSELSRFFFWLCTGTPGKKHYSKCLNQLRLERHEE